MRLRTAVLLVLVSCHRRPSPDPVTSIRADDIRRYQETLASDAFEGRGAGSEGGHRASAYIAEQIRALGLLPAGMENTYFQSFGEGRRNVVARWPGRASPEYVILGAHYDHLGKQGETIYPGADDNASGSSAILDVASAVIQTRFRRAVVLIWFDEEENNLAGSRWWASHPTLPLELCVAMLNCDMIGRNETSKIFCGVEKTPAKAARYPKWEAEVRKVQDRFGATFDWSEFDPYIKRSDHWSFMERDIPALFFTGGLHADYHTPGDRIQKINFAKEELIARILYSILASVADRTEPLK